METTLKKEWFDSQWVLIADADPARAIVLKRALLEVGFPEERTEIRKNATDALKFIIEHHAAIVILDDSLGSAAFREIHARLYELFGALGFFLFTVTEGKNSEFTQFAATARIDGLIFRPYPKSEFQHRLAETFTVKWPNRYVAKNEQSDLYIAGGKSDNEIFKRALEKERRLGNRDTHTPDPKIGSILGFKKVDHPGIKQGKASFEKVRLAFRVTARNGVALEKAVPIHAMEVDEYSATFECNTEGFEPGDHVSIEAEIVHGPESYQLRIEATVKGEAGLGLIAMVFDEGNRTRFESAMRMVTKRFKELKDFFKYAKGA